MKKRINITIEDSIIKKFQEYCEKKGMKVSSKIELLVKKELKENN